MTKKIEKISSIILWSSMAISIIVFCVFLWNSVFGSSEETISETTGMLLNWMYVLFGIVVVTALFFILKHIIDVLKNRPKSALKLVLPIIAFVFILLLSYILGNGNLLNMPQYEGDGNTYFWLKITDMWLYSIYFLLGLTILSILGGIIWSYIKKN